MPRIAMERLVVGEIAVNCYLVENTETQEVFIVDPGAEAERIIQRVGSRKPVAVLLTHGHYDHIGAVDAVCQRFDIPVYMHEMEADKLAEPRANLSSRFAVPVVQTTLPALVHDGDVLHLAGMDIEVLHTPGHSAGGVCYRLPENQGVLTGDTLFAHGYGRTDFYDSDFAALHQSLRRLFALTPRMISFPGHDIPGVVGRDAAEEA